MNTGQYSIKADPRASEIKSSQLRNTGLIPAVVYGNGHEPMAITLNTAEFTKLFHHAGESSLISLEISGGTKPVLVKEPQFHPVTGEIIHVDLYEVNMREKIKAEIPLTFENEAPALTTHEATLVTNKDSLEVECLPSDLPHDIKVDLSGLENIEDHIKVSDIKVPAGVEVLTDPEEIVVLVSQQREEEEEAPVSEAEAIAAVEATAEKPEETA